MIVIKLGGSLMPYARKLLFAISSELDHMDYQTDNVFPQQVIIVPGGGVFADTIRKVYGEYHLSHESRTECNDKSDAEYGLTEEAAHNMAILAMEQYGYFLSGISGIPVCDSVDTDCKLPIRIILPARMLLGMCEDSFGDNHNGEDAGMPHTWDTTSDAIATWIAHRCNANIIKATDIDGIMQDGTVLEQISARELIKWDTSCVDTVTPEMLLRHRLDCVVVNGQYPERIIDAIRYIGQTEKERLSGNFMGTLIHWKDNV